jgi:2-keto-4-pentenoate hydratase
MAPVWEDPRVVRGFERQLEARRRRLETGEQPVGWKLGMGTQQAMEAIGTTGPLVGYLTQRTLVPAGREVVVGDWTEAVLEPELAVHVAHDVPGGADLETAAAAIGSLAPAIELVDFDGPRGHVESVLAGNIFHRAVLLGDRGAASAEGVRLDLVRDGETVAETDEPTALNGPLPELVRHVADFLAAFGEMLRAGEVIITGSVVPALPVAAGQRLEARFPPLGEVSVSLG